MMLADFKMDDEAGRRRALLRYSVLDTGQEVAFERVVSTIKHLFDVPICAVSLVDADRQWFKARRGLNVCGTARSVAFCDHTIRTPEPMIICDAAADPRFCDNPLVTGAPHISAYMGAPLVSPDGYAVGSICAIDTRPRNFKVSDGMTMTSFADIVVTELELRLRASVDMLSGLLTRRAFMEQANAQIASVKQGPACFAAVMIDLDFFKSINDRFGHDQGDEVIRQTGAVLRDLVPASEIVSRIGGEEFAVMMRCSSIETAMARGEQIRSAIAHRVRIGTPAERVTASIGIALVKPGQATIDDALRSADLGLYCAKSSGRNRVGNVGSVLPQFAKAS